MKIDNLRESQCSRLETLNSGVTIAITHSDPREVFAIDKDMEIMESGSFAISGDALRFYRELKERFEAA